MRIRKASWVAWGITSYIVFALGVNGCSQILGIEEWEDPLASSATGGGSGGDVDNGAGGAAPTCVDGIKNGPTESDVDCGGDACAPCALGKACNDGGDCLSLTCVNNLCVHQDKPPCVPDSSGGVGGGTAGTCNDCVQNGAESDIDCGSEPCQPCGFDKHCMLDSDCFSSQCVDGKCRGAVGDPCKQSFDCQSALCDVGNCWTGYCCQ